MTKTNPVRGGLLGRTCLAALLACGFAAGQYRAASAQQIDKIKVSAVRVTSIGALLIAEKLGYFKEQNIEPDVDLYDAGQTSVLAVVSGSDEIAAGALTSSLYGLAAKGAMKIVAGQVFANAQSPSGGLVASKAAWDAGLRSPKDIVGKRIGITTTGGSAHYELGLIGQKYGFTVNQLTIVPLQSQSNVVAAVVGNQVDAAIAGVPGPQRLISDHHGHLLTWASKEIPYQEGAVFVNAKTLAARRPVIARYLVAYAKGCADYDEAFTKTDKDGNPVHGAHYDEYSKLVSDLLGVPAKQLEGTYPYCDPTEKLDMSDLNRQLAFWQSFGAVDKSVKLADVIDPMVK